MNVFYSPKFVLDLPENHRFPILKYELIIEQLLHEGVISKSEVLIPNPIKNEFLELLHDSVYLEKLKTLTLDKKEIRKMGFPLTNELIEREYLVVGASYDASLDALKNGVSFNGAGGTHHAYESHGEGFCLLNDFAVAAQAMLHESRINKALIFDLDVHQGNGTAKLLENESNIYTVSVHGQANYPHRKESSDMDISLETGITDSDYLTIIENLLHKSVEASKPDIVYYQAGVDILETDKLGKLSISLNGCKERDKIVLEYLHSLKIPVVVAMGGGYSPKISDIINAHVNTFKVAINIFE